jgi:hypothetical protein
MLIIPWDAVPHRFIDPNQNLELARKRQYEPLAGLCSRVGSISCCVSFPSLVRNFPATSCLCCQLHCFSLLRVLRVVNLMNDLSGRLKRPCTLVAHWIVWNCLRTARGTSANRDAHILGASPFIVAGLIAIVWSRAQSVATLSILRFGARRSRSFFCIAELSEVCAT